MAEIKRIIINSEELNHEVTGGWRKLRNEELRNLYHSSSIIRMIESRRMRRAGHGGEEEYIEDIGGKSRRKETTGETKA
jgi:hypothetical protein